MTVQTSRFPRPVRVPSSRQAFNVLEPVQGINRSRPPQHLEANEAWDVVNFELEDQSLKFRSGLSQQGTSRASVEGPLLVLATYIDSTGDTWAIASDLTYMQKFSFGPTAASSAWTLADTASTHSFQSNTTSDYYDWAVSYDAAREEPVAFFTNGVSTSVAVAGNTLIERGAVTSMLNPKYVAAFDERVLYFVDSGAGASTFRPNRVWWTNKGIVVGNTADTTNFGFQDLANMQGEGTGIQPFGDVLYIFSEKEVWGAIARQDVFAFTFQPINTKIGCPFPRTIVQTSVGVVFLSQDFRLYVADQGQVNPISPQINDLLQREIANTVDIFGVFDAQDNSYKLFYSNDSGYPNRSLNVQLDGDGGVARWEATDSSTCSRFVVAASITDDSITTASRPLMVGCSDVSFYRALSDQTSDNGQDILAQYVTPAVNPSYEFMAPTDMWLEHQSTTTSTLTVDYSTDLFASNSVNVATATLDKAASGTSSTVPPLTEHIPLTGQASRHPMFRLQVGLAAGSSNDVRINRIQVVFNRYTGRHSG